MAAGVAIRLLQGVGKADDGLAKVLLQRDVGQTEILVGVDQALVQACVLDGHRRATAEHVEHLALALAELGALAVAVGAQHANDAALELERDRTEADQALLGRAEQEAMGAGAVREQGLVLLKQREDLGEIQGWCRVGGAEPGRNPARMLDERPWRITGAAVGLRSLQQEIRDVGVDRIEHRLENQIEDPLDRKGGRDGLADPVDGEGILETQVLVLQALAVEPALHGVDYLLDAEGLEHVVVGAVLHGFDGGLDSAKAGHDDSQHRNAQLGDLFDQLEAAHVGHLQI